MTVANEGMRFQPVTTGEFKAPADCCSYGVVDWSKGKEICRVWEEADARLIANLLNDAFDRDTNEEALTEYVRHSFGAETGGK